MNALIVLAHPEPKSYNAHLADLAATTLSRHGYAVQISDLYGANFDSCEGPCHFTAPKNPDRFDAQREQRHSWDTQSTPSDVQAEIDKIMWADLVIFQFPLWWFGPPAILKGWIDRVFIYGGLYTSAKRYDRGPCAGKKTLFCVTAGASETACSYNGHEGDTRLILWPNLFSLRYVGFTVLEPFILHGVRGGLSGDALAAYEKRLADRETRYQRLLANIETAPVVKFNSDDDWDENGQLKATAPVYSPFIRRHEHMHLG